MSFLISCRKPQETYFLYIFYFMLLVILGGIINIIFNYINNKIFPNTNNANDTSDIKKENQLILKFIRYIAFSLFFIPEFKNNLSKKNKNSNFKYNYKFEDIANIGFTSLFFLIDDFINIFDYNSNSKNERLFSNNHAIFYFFSFIFSILIFKKNNHIHQYISIIIIIILAIYRIIIKSIYNLNNNLLNIVMLLSINIVDSFSMAFIYANFKIVMEKYFFSYYKTLYIFGFINGIIILIIYLILSYIPCKEKNLFCQIGYNDHYYFDNIMSFFHSHNWLQIINIFVCNLISSFNFIFIIAINYKFTICHSFFIIQFSELTMTLTELSSYKNKIISSSILICCILEILILWIK